MNSWGAKLRERKCKKCNKLFKQTGYSQSYCLICGKIHNRETTDKFNEKLRQQRIKEKENEVPPRFYCPNDNCQHSKKDNPIQLDFQPKEDNLRWSKFRCPLCNSRIGSSIN
jgi:uncharacterized Zn finger protein (UPF0148 family)